MLTTVFRGAVCSLCLCLTAVAAQDEAAVQSTGVEFRFAKETSSDEYPTAVRTLEDQQLYLSATPLLTGADVASVEFSRRPDGGVRIGLTFRAEVVSKLTTTTQQHLDDYVVILLDGQVVVAPRVRAPIAARAVIDGQFSDETLKRLFEALVLAPAPDAAESNVSEQPAGADPNPEPAADGDSAVREVSPSESRD